MSIIENIDKKQLKEDLPEINIGDTLRISLRIIEGDKERLQDFEGVLIAKKGGGLKESITLRKISYGEGVERVFLLHSPRLEKIKIIRKGHTRRAKLYYLRERTGKRATKVKEKKSAK